MPGATAGYSGTPLPRKLGIKERQVVALLGAPPDFEETLGPLPPRVRLRHSARGRAQVVLLFAPTSRILHRRFPAAERMIGEKGRLWLCWPKKSSPLHADLGEALVRRHGLDAGWVDYKICAIDGDWSGLCFARR